ncbi:MAG: hypothetical protein IT350_02935 [Deltaproteobacteria bacterium]|nr:hypothetical protein [Deltaproteobacteria bacterium]
MRTLRQKWWVVLCALVFASWTACGGGGDDDDDSGAPADDDSGLGGDDDDDDLADDDTTDDDTADDDTADDDTADDDTTDDDTADDDTADDDTGDDDTGPTTIFDIDFEDYTNGNLGFPWGLDLSGDTTMVVGDLVAADGSGKVVYQTGDVDTEGGDFLVAQYGFNEQDDDVWVSFDVSVADSGVDFGFRTVLEYYGYAYPQTQLVVENATVKALNFTTSAMVTCGTLTALDWDNVAVLYNYSSGTYDVNLNGSSTACDNVPANATQYPAYGLQVVDWSDDTYGGVATFDNFHGEIDGGADMFDIDFTAYAEGPLAAPWAIVDQDGTSEANIVTLTAADGAGKALELDGGTTITIADYVLASYGFASTPADLNVYFDVFYDDTDTEFGFRTMQNPFTGATPGAQLLVEAGYLSAYDYTPGTWVDCGALTVSEWHTVEVRHTYAAKTYSIWVDEAESLCVGLQTGSVPFNGPFNGIQLIDWSDEGYGGNVMWDNLLGIAP